MKPLYRGLIVALFHILIVSSLGAKLLYDRTTLPRIWVKTVPFDPNLPIRGRYVRLRLEMEARGFPIPTENVPGNERPRRGYHQASLVVENDQLVAVSDQNGRLGVRQLRRENDRTLGVLAEPLAFFITEHIKDPSIRTVDEELWAEVTISPKGPPRPIRLGVKKSGQLTPLNLD